jgi:hypothetical protein
MDIYYGKIKDLTYPVSDGRYVLFERSKGSFYISNEGIPDIIRLSEFTYHHDLPNHNIPDASLTPENLELYRNLHIVMDSGRVIEGLITELKKEIALESLRVRERYQKEFEEEPYALITLEGDVSRVFPVSDSTGTHGYLLTLDLAILASDESTYVQLSNYTVQDLSDTLLSVFELQTVNIPSFAKLNPIALGGAYSSALKPKIVDRKSRQALKPLPSHKE